MFNVVYYCVYNEYKLTQYYISNIAPSNWGDSWAFGMLEILLFIPIVLSWEQNVTEVPPKLSGCRKAPY